MFAGGGVDTLDPKRAEIALLQFAADIGVLLRLFDGLLCRFDQAAAGAVIAASGFENFLVLGVGGNATFDAGHGRFLRVRCFKMSAIRVGSATGIRQQARFREAHFASSPNYVFRCLLSHSTPSRRLPVAGFYYLYTAYTS